MSNAKTIRWWTNGDHPKDKSVEIPLTERTANLVSFLTEGEVVGHYECTDECDELCPTCGAPYRIHGQISGGPIVHPGDYVSVNKTKAGYTVEHPDPMAQAAATMAAAGVEVHDG